MRKTYVTLVITVLCGLLLGGLVFQPSRAALYSPDDIWKTLFKVQWHRKFNTALKINVDAPKFTPEIKALDNKEVTIRGYVVPVEMYGGGDYIILSAYPANQCFFCGGAGPESVIEVYAQNPGRSFSGDRITLKGRLELNEDDHSHLIYILRDAVQVYSK